MRVSMEWLQQFIDIQEEAEEIAEILTNGGVEVENVEYLNHGLDKIVIGEITELKAHPDADKLQIAKADTGKESVIVVTGADNIRVRDKVPVALPGTVLPGGLEIKPVKLRGIESNGMLCSDKELDLEGVGKERSKGGILILEEDAPKGEKLSHYLGLDNWVLELELYPNRPDCLAMVNVAREVGTLLNRKPTLHKWAQLEIPYWPKAEQQIQIENPELSWRYSALLVDDVKIKPSPLWMRNRLRAAGVRPISNIVDITNYCMLEMGQPLHAFDRDKIQGKVRVRLAEAGEKIITLDGAERKLDPDMLVIADDSGPIAIAGVMGGLATEVTNETKSILFESAHFLGSSIRRTSRKLGLRSESSNRFEKGVNPYGTVPTLGRVAELLEELNAGTASSFVEEVKHLPELRTIQVSLAKTSRLLGIEVSGEEMNKVMGALGFIYKERAGVYDVDIPSYRQDLLIEEDLIEEAARIIGYDKIPTTLPMGAQTQGRRTPEQEFRLRLRKLFIRLGMNEVVTYSFVKKDNDDPWGYKNKSIPLMNPLREELGVMRTSLIPGLLEIASRNVARRNLDLLLFEIGSVYLAKGLPLRELPEERTKIAGLTEGKSKRHWQKNQVDYDFFYVKGILTELARECGVELEYRRVLDSKVEKLLHPGRSAEIFIGDEQVGFMGEIYPKLDEEWGLLRPILFELDFSVLFGCASPEIIARSYPRFPAIQRDLAVVVPEEIAAGDIKQRIYELGGELLQQVEIFDLYKGDPVPSGHKSLAFTMRYQSAERTLKDEEVSALNSRILEGIQQEFGAEWRK